MTLFLALDPGDPHNGLALFDDEHPDGWRCVAAWELGNAECEDYLTKVANQTDLNLWVVEQFNLYPDKAMAQTGSIMGTPERIGVAKYLARQHGIELILQPAAIQEPTAGVLRSRGIRSMAKRTKAGPHALSAELHGWHYLIRPDTR